MNSNFPELKKLTADVGDSSTAGSFCQFKTIVLYFSGSQKAMITLALWRANEVGSHLKQEYHF